MRLLSPWAERVDLWRTDLLAAYLGSEAGRRVYEGQIERGDVQTIAATTTAALRPLGEHRLNGIADPVAVHGRSSATGRHSCPAWPELAPSRRVSLVHARDPDP